MIPSVEELASFAVNVPSFDCRFAGVAISSGFRRSVVYASSNRRPHSVIRLILARGHWSAPLRPGRPRIPKRRRLR